MRDVGFGEGVVAFGVVFFGDFEEVHSVVVHHRVFDDFACAQFGQCAGEAGRDGAEVDVAQVVVVCASDAGARLLQVAAAVAQGL